MNNGDSDLKNSILAAVSAKEWDRAKQLLDLAKETAATEAAQEDLNRKRNELARQLATLTGRPQPEGTFSGRLLKLPVTIGSLTYGYLIVTRPLSDGELNPGEKLRITIPTTGDSFSTDIYLRNKVLSERPLIKKFYKAAGIQAGDFVRLKETAPGEWRLTKWDVTTPPELHPPGAQQAPACNTPSKHPQPSSATPTTTQHALTKT